MRKSIEITLFVILISVWAAPHRISNQAQASETGSEIINKMIGNYGSYSSYQDHGIVKLQFHEKGSLKFTAENHFKTYYVRPDRFRLEWTSVAPYVPSRHHVIWMKSSAVSTYLEPDVYRTDADLGLALYSVGGISAGVSTLVPLYLIGNKPELSFGNPKRVGIIGEELLYGNHMYVVGFEYEDDRKKRVWVDKASYTIRRLESWSEKKKGSGVLETIEFTEVQINGLIPDSTFDYTPPVSLSSKSRGKNRPDEGDASRLW